MYASELQPIDLPIDFILLDPNNPRWRSRTEKVVPDERISNEKIQLRAAETLDNRFGIEELKNSILRNGFLPLDRIVVRPLDNDEKLYVVVEGNRRLAAIRRLRDEIEQEAIEDDDLPDGYLETLQDSLTTVSCLVYQGNDRYINWMLQGIRHLSGIRDWDTAQQAELVAQQVEEGHNFTQIGQMFGLTNRQVGRLYRGYRGLRQMADDDEFGDKAKNDLFTLFDEAHRNPEVRKWLGWNDDSARYENADNLQTFYSWIIEDEDYDGQLNKRRIHDPRHMKALNKILAKRAGQLLHDIDSHSITIETAEGRLDESEEPEIWQAEVDRARQALSRVPAQALRVSPGEARQALESLRDVLEGLLAMIPDAGAGE